MRASAEHMGISLKAISGTHSVLLVFDFTDPAKRNGLLGFSIKYKDILTGKEEWMRGFKFFKETIAAQEVGQRLSTFEHPIQSLQWGHYSAKPGRVYEYMVYPVYGTPQQIQHGQPVVLQIETENPDDGVHAIFFNQGAITSQAFADRFGNQGPSEEEQNDPANEKVKWLSRGLLEAALAFIEKADGPHHQLLVGAYELSYKPIIMALKSAAQRGVQVKICYEAGKKTVSGVRVDTSTTIGNRKAIAEAGLTSVDNLTLIKRKNRASIPHNKFIVLLENNVATQVLTGSTNFTPSGFLGQSNVIHIVRDRDIAAQYQTYWEKLAQDPIPKDFKAFCTGFTPEVQGELEDESLTLMFSPRKRSTMLDWYGRSLESASSSVMLTSAFGVTKRLASYFDNDKNYLRFLLMERRSRSEEAREMLRRDRDTRIAMGKAFNSDSIQLKLPGYGLDQWLRKESHFRKKGHVFYIHTKIMLLDVFQKTPKVFSGSANFSPASLLANDENMLLISGNRRVADIYATEFLRLFNHFYFRHVAAMVAKRHRNKNHEVPFLKPDNSWLDSSFRPNSYHSRRRELFARMFID